MRILYPDHQVEASCGNERSTERSQERNERTKEVVVNMEGGNGKVGVKAWSLTSIKGRRRAVSE